MKYSSEYIYIKKNLLLEIKLIRIKINMVDINFPESLQAMQKFSETYAKRTGTFFCSDLSITAVVIEGLARHKDEYGAPLCPCRHYDDKEA